MRNAPLGSFCNTFDLLEAIICLENQFSVFLRVVVLHRVYCTQGDQWAYKSALLSGPSEKRHFMAFRWWPDSDPRLYAGWEKLVYGYWKIGHCVTITMQSDFFLTDPFIVSLAAAVAGWLPQKRRQIVPNQDVPYLLTGWQVWSPECCPQSMIIPKHCLTFTSVSLLSLVCLMLDSSPTSHRTLSDRPIRSAVKVAFRIYWRLSWSLLRIVTQRNRWQYW